MTGPRVSLVTPTYNQAGFLEATIDSVLAQTHTPLDYRVIDDGSTDATAAVLARYPNIPSSRQANRGQAATLNEAWADARGEYLGYLSSDDLLLPDAVATMVAALEERPDAVCAFPQAHLIDARGRVLKRNVYRLFDLAELVVKQECWIGPGAIFRADAYHAVGGWRSDLRLAPDREFWMRLAAHGAFIFVDRPLALYRLHPRATSYALSTEAASREYLIVLDGYFAGDPPSAILARRDEAYGRAHLLIARNAVRGGDLAAAARHWRRARALHSPLGGPRPALALLRAAVGKPLRMTLAALLGYH